MDPRTVFEKMEGVRRKTLSILEGLNQDQLDWRSPDTDRDEAWSLGEVFMHLAIDEIYLREMLALPLLEGIKPPEGVTFLPPPPPYGARKEVILFWFERARSGTLWLFENWPADADLDTKHEGGLREMNGIEWFEGYAGHEAFHHRQIRDLIAQLPI